MNWSETRRKLLQLAARRPDRRVIGQLRRSRRGPDGEASSTGRTNGHSIEGGFAGATMGAATEAQPHAPREERIGLAVRASSICIASGKGGTGKTCVSASLAHLFSSRGRTLIVDGDLGVGNAHILQDVSPPKTVVDVVDGTVPIRDVVVPCSGQVDLVAAGSGVPRMADLSSYEMHLIADGLEEIELDYRFVVVDSAAGVSRQTISFAEACDLTLIVTTPDLTAMTDAYAFLKVLLGRGGNRPLLLVNRARDEEQAREVTQRILAVCERFVGRWPRPIGWLPEDPLVGDCVNRRGAVVLLEPNADFSYALRQKVVLILGELDAVRAEGFGRRLLGGVGYPA